MTVTRPRSDSEYRLEPAVVGSLNSGIDVALGGALMPGGGGVCAAVSVAWVAIQVAAKQASQLRRRGRRGEDAR